MIRINGEWNLYRGDAGGGTPGLPSQLWIASAPVHPSGEITDASTGTVLGWGHIVHVGGYRSGVVEDMPISGSFDPATNHILFTESPEYGETSVTIRHYDGYAVVDAEGRVFFGWAGSHSEVVLEGGGGMRRWGLRYRPFTGGWFATPTR